ncbi:MAG: hypothetical protein HYV47_01125 [Candidatus Nealsonbacteria bacterium]|nr:hypothetical protein [Candidatus Nealsonbacteria bacterium]
MSIRKYKYYFTKPKSEIGKDIFRWLMIAGAVSIAATSPCFLTNLLKYHQKFKKYPKQKVSDTFYHFRKQGLINIQENNHQICISLTREGKKKAGWLQIDNLKIAKPKKWDDKWRMVMFDIAQLKKFHRDAFRSKLKTLGFYQFQKSIWVYPFDCRAEIDLLRTFFGLLEKELRLVVAENLGDDRELRKAFNL